MIRSRISCMIPPNHVPIQELIPEPGVRTERSAGEKIKINSDQVISEKQKFINSLPINTIQQ